MVVPPFSPCPATGDAFIGRQGLARNLRRRIARGESLAVIGGPKLGKTSLVRTALQGLTDHPMLGRSGTLAGVSFRVFPLSVLLDGETRRLIGRDMSPGLAAWSGNHPYLTKLLLHYMDWGGDEKHRTLERAVAAGRCQWEPFVQ